MPHNLSFDKSVITSGNDTLVDLMKSFGQGSEKCCFAQHHGFNEQNPFDVPRQRSTQIEPTNLLLEDAWGSKRKALRSYVGPEPL